MRGLLRTARLDVSESMRARWFLLYSVVFGGLMVALLLSGLADSRIMGFTGLSRLLLIYIQLTMAILPVFILLTTVRSVAGDREVGVYEYMLSLPVELSAWFWGKLMGRFLVIFIPVFCAMLGAAVWALLSGHDVPWFLFLMNTAFIVSLAVCFLGISFLVSSLARTSDIAQGAAFAVWLVMLLFMDLILLGAMVSGEFEPELIVGIALVNPLQAFRTAAMLLFDSDLMLMGPAAFVILDNFGREGFFAFALAYPVLIGLLSSYLGYRVFRRSDLV